jgi:hypothetical protein
MRALQLRLGERVGLIIVRRPDPTQWNLDRIANTVDEDKQLTEQGLANWSVDLESEGPIVSLLSVIVSLDCTTNASRTLLQLCEDLGKPA